jgi:adenylate kinase
MKLIFLGPPGAGKGTQAENLCKDYNIIQISTGDIFRANMKNSTELGKKAKSYIDAGNLVPDSLVIDMIKEELKDKKYESGYLLDGFPRTVAQAEAFDSMLAESNQKIDAVLVLEVPNDELLKRLTARRVCRVCGKSYHLIYNPPKTEGICDADGGELYQRDDDKEEPILNRLKVYENQTFPLIEYYKKQGSARMIDGLGAIEEIYNRIKKALG